MLASRPMSRQVEIGEALRKLGLLRGDAVKRQPEAGPGRSGLLRPWIPGGFALFDNRCTGGSGNGAAPFGLRSFAMARVVAEFLCKTVL